MQKTFWETKAFPLAGRESLCDDAPMENHRLVLPGHMNQYGFLFGGYLLAWVDELAWMAASRDFPGCQLVTVGMKEVAFKKSVREGAILSLRSSRTRLGGWRSTWIRRSLLRVTASAPARVRSHAAMADRSPGLSRAARSPATAVAAISDARPSSAGIASINRSP